MLECQISNPPSFHNLTTQTPLPSDTDLNPLYSYSNNLHPPPNFGHVLAYLYILINDNTKCCVHVNFDSLNNKVFVTDERSISGLSSILFMFEENLCPEIGEKEFDRLNLGAFGGWFGAEVGIEVGLLGEGVRGEEEGGGFGIGGRENFEVSVGEIYEEGEDRGFGAVIGEEQVGALFGKLPEEFGGAAKEMFEKMVMTLEAKNGKIGKLGKDLEAGRKEIRGLRDKNEGYESLNIKYDKVLDELYQKDQEVSSYMDAIEERDRKLRYYEEADVSTKTEA
jgi:hypothetical protein